jgi:DNA sulfur modification protein DndD
MILRKIALKNFRQFYGEQSIPIAPPGARNVTLIHAENGVGKTTLLNALLWTFFGDTTKRFEQKDKIVNFEAEADGDTLARVEIEFENEGSVYVATREVWETPAKYKKVNFEVIPVQPNGTRSPPIPNPERFVHSVIPRHMAQYFFFDGEQAETFSAETNYKEVGGAIRDILGCALLETAKGDLDYLAKAFDKELGELQGEDQIRQRETQIADYEAKLETRKREIDDATQNIDTLSKQLEDILEGLRRAEASAKIQAERDLKAKALEECLTQISENDVEVVRWIAQKGPAVVSPRLVSTTLDFVNSESLRGRIPSPYNEEFVESLLRDHKCVCDRPLSPGTPEWQAVRSLLEYAANAEALNRLVRVRARVATLKEQYEEAPQQLQQLQTRSADLSNRRRALQQELEELGSKLGQAADTDVAERERARGVTARKIELLKLERQAAQTESQRDQKEIDRLRGEVATLAARNEHAMKLVRRRQVAILASRRLQQILEHYESEARAAIEEEVNRILARVARRDYRLEIGEHFELRLVFSDGRPTPKSGGENQLMSLAFIAALVQYAQKRLDDRSNRLFIPATTAPLILDSPFGQLDDAYRSATASFVPEMAPQVVLLVSSSQGKSEVFDALHRRVGAEYALIAENRGPKGDRRQDSLNVNGSRLATTLFNRPRSLTRVEEVTRS